MENSHLIAVLKTLDKKEVKEFRKWLESPCHNQRQDVVDLFDYLTTNNHLGEEKFLKKERVYKKVFRAEPYDDAKLRQTMHFLSRNLEDFLTYQEIQEDKTYTNLALIAVYRKRNLEKALLKVIHQTEKQMEESPYHDARRLRHEYLLQMEKYDFLSQKKRTVELNLQQVSDVLDTVYLSDKLRQCCILQSHQTVYKAEYQIALLPEVLAYVEEKALHEIPAIGVYYYIYKAQTDKSNPEHFQKLKTLITKNEDGFPQSEMRNIYLFAINYCLRMANMGDQKYLRELFELYKRGAETMTLIENGALSQFTFKNTVTAGVTLKEFAWVRGFIENYQQYIDPQIRESFVHFSLARLHFEMGDYHAAQRMLIHFEHDDILTNLHAKSMLIRIYYEDGEFDALESLLESMRSYVARKKVIGYHRNIYSNLIRYTRRLVRVKPYDERQKEKLRKEIEGAQPLTEKKWLLEQLDAM
jgi:hypothetical protein